MSNPLRNIFHVLREHVVKAGKRLRHKNVFSNTQESTAGALEKKLVLLVKQSRKLPTVAQFINLPHILKKTERIALYIAAIVFIVSAGLLGRNIFHDYRTVMPRSGGSYTEAIIGQPKLINPLWAQANTADRDLTQLIYDGLFRYAPDLTLKNDLAESVAISEDKKTYTITLRDGLTWHDGQPLTTTDVAFTIHAAQNPSYRSPWKSDFANVKVEAIDPRTLTITLEAPYAPFLHALTIGILPEHLWGNIPPETAPLAELNLKPVGSGPYQFEKLRKTKSGTIHSYTLKKNKSYHGQVPYISTLNFRFFQDYRSAVSALAQGNVQGVAFIPYELQEELKRRQDITYHDLPLSQVTALFFNQKENKILTEKLVREALAHSLDKTAIISDAFRGHGIPLDAPALPGSLGYTTEVRTYPFDSAHAAGLLEENGWKLEDGKTTRVFVPANKQDKRFSKDTELKLSLVTVQVPEYVRAAELIRDAWSALGVSVELSVVDSSTLDRDILPERKFDVLLYGEILGSNPDPYPFWHSSQINSPGVNLAQYANRRVDGLLEEARTLHDETERAKRYEEFQKTVANELPAIFLLAPSYIYAVDDEVRGINIAHLGNPGDRFAGINEWFVKTKTRF